MLTEEDFKEAEDAIKTINQLHSKVSEIVDAQNNLEKFAKKVLAQARRDFLTDPNDLEARVKSLENKFEQVKVVFTTRGTQTIPKITPMK